MCFSFNLNLQVFSFLIFSVFSLFPHTQRGASSMAGAEKKKNQQKPIVVAEKKNQHHHHEEDTVNNKFNQHNFLYKAAIIAFFFVILPLFPSQAPEFIINQSAIVTRNWELLHILFVGLAISYGLFSRKNKEDDEASKENNGGSKFDNAQSLVSRFLQVSSFFEDDAAETTPPAELSSSSSSDHESETKVQTWSNQHHRNEPVVVVTRSQHAHHHSNFDNKVGTEKPLLLPVRSLKSRLCDDDGDDDDDDVHHVNESSTRTSSLSHNRSITSKTGSKSFSRNNSSKSRNIAAEIDGPGGGGGSLKIKDNVVLPSPIPWRSRSGRLLEPNKQELTEEPEFSNKAESRSAKSSQNPRPLSRTSPSPNKEISLNNSPNSSIPSESVAKNAEDAVRKKGFCKSYPPPPPPPPPMFHKSILMRPRYGAPPFDSRVGTELKRSFTSEGGMKKSGVMEGNIEENFMEEPTRKTNMFMEEEKEEASFLDKVVMESYDDDEDSETEDEDVGETQPVGEVSRTDGASSGSIGGEEGPDVDKKADEFIAKFREQIRLQRIESIKRITRSTKK